MYQHEQDLLREYHTLLKCKELLTLFIRAIGKVVKEDGDSLDEELVSAMVTIQTITKHVVSKGVRFSDGTFTVGIVQHLKDVREELQVLQVGKPTREPRRKEDNAKKEDKHEDGGHTETAP